MASMLGPIFNDAATILGEMYKGVTGQDVTSQIVDTSTFVSVAETMLRYGMDPVMNALSQTLSRTLFSIRPRSARMIGMQQDRIEYGNHVRKVSYEDTDPQADPSWTLKDGQSVDQQVVQTPKILQTNMYGVATYCRQMTRFETQLKNALLSPEELVRFYSGLVLHMSNQLQTDGEAFRHNLLANWMCGKTTADPKGVIYLLDEYNAQTGQSLTTANVYAPENYRDFAQWAFARIRDVSDLLRDRTVCWHQLFTDHDKLMRHTPYEYQNMYLFSASQYQMESRVLANVFGPQYNQYRNFEMVPYWQQYSPDFDDRCAVSCTPMVTGIDGTAKKGAAVGLSNVFGCILDRDALGYTIVDTSVDPSPYNARGRYRNTWYHYAFRYWTDFTENGVLFLLTSADVTAPEQASMALSNLDQIDSTGDAAEDAATLAAAKASAAKAVKKMDAELSDQ